jgi:hypothetical protein
MNQTEIKDLKQRLEKEQQLKTLKMQRSFLKI